MLFYINIPFKLIVSNELRIAKQYFNLSLDYSIVMTLQIAMKTFEL